MLGVSALVLSLFLFVSSLTKIINIINHSWGFRKDVKRFFNGMLSFSQKGKNELLFLRELFLNIRLSQVNLRTGERG